MRDCFLSNGYSYEQDANSCPCEAHFVVTGSGSKDMTEQGILESDKCFKDNKTK